jgi:hypothetical protein
MSSDGVFSFFAELFGTLETSDPPVLVTDEGVVRRLPRGRSESVRWDDLCLVEIHTTDAGPFAEDFFWVLHGSAGGVVVPGAVAEGVGLLDRLQRLSGFDNAAVIRACGSTECAQFVCWDARDL